MKMCLFRELLLACLFTLAFAAPALAEDELIILGSKESRELSTAQRNFFKDKGVPFILADIAEFAKYKKSSTLFIFALADSPVLDEIFGADSPELKKIRSLRLARFEHVGDKFVPGQNIFLFVGGTPNAAFNMSRETRDDWWPLLGNLFDIKILQDEIFAY